MRQFDDFMLDFADAVKRSNARVVAMKGVNNSVDPVSVNGVAARNSVFVTVGYRGDWDMAISLYIAGQTDLS